MFRVKSLNKIAEVGITRFVPEEFQVSPTVEDPDAIIVRSYEMNDMVLPDTLKAIARAGAGYNNIPVDRCTKRGIVVFNTPGANANSVKELTIASIFLASRRIHEGIEWARSLADKGEAVSDLVEKEKSRFAGPEIKGKTLGVIGLGAVGVLVANSASDLGMEVLGYDPFISVESAWGLSRAIKRASHLDTLCATADYITVHVPLSDRTRNFIDKSCFAKMKKGVRVLNLARGGLISRDDLLDALDAGIVERYVTDFPSKELISHEKVISIPHLGASTPEAEDNCAIMAADQLIDFLTTGNIRNSVNFPTCEMPISGVARIVIANRNIPNMVGQISTILAREKINISDMLNRHRGDYAYNIIDIEGTLSKRTFEQLSAVEGVVMARIVRNE